MEEEKNNILNVNPNEENADNSESELTESTELLVGESEPYKEINEKYIKSISDDIESFFDKYNISENESTDTNYTKFSNFLIKKILSLDKDTPLTDLPKVLYDEYPDIYKYNNLTDILKTFIIVMFSEESNSLTEYAIEVITKIDLYIDQVFAESAIELKQKEQEDDEVSELYSNTCVD